MRGNSIGEAGIITLMLAQLSVDNDRTNIIISL